MGVAMTALLHQEGRRVVLVFTDGMDRPINGRAATLSFKDVRHTRGAGRRDDLRDRPGRHRRRSGAWPPRRLGGSAAAARSPDKPDPGLQKLALASGGGYFELTATRDLASTFTRVVDELHRQYLIGFVPQKLDGKVHKLEVRVRGDGLIARARKSYVAAR